MVCGSNIQIRAKWWNVFTVLFSMLHESVSNKLTRGRSGGIYFLYIFILFFLLFFLFFCLLPLFLFSSCVLSWCLFFTFENIAQTNRKKQQQQQTKTRKEKLIEEKTHSDRSPSPSRRLTVTRCIRWILPWGLWGETTQTKTFFSVLCYVAFFWHSWTFESDFRLPSPSLTACLNLLIKKNKWKKKLLVERVIAEGRVTHVIQNHIIIIIRTFPESFSPENFPMPHNF